MQLAIVITSLGRAEMCAVLADEEKRIPEGIIGNFLKAYNVLVPIKYV